MNSRSDCWTAPSTCVSSVARLNRRRARCCSRFLVIGHWSVDIYFLMALRRPDVWPRGDLALAIAMRDVKRLGDVPSREQQAEMAERWSPWRSVAARILWMHYLAR